MRLFTTLGALLLTLTISAQSALINEINYAATDPTGRGVEIVAEAGADLTGWSVAIYSVAGMVQEVIDISDALIPNQQNGYGTVWYEVVQNDNGGGAALIDPTGSVAQFVSYGIAHATKAKDGPADGARADYVGSAPAGSSVGLVGKSFDLLGFQWALNVITSPGSINTDQIFMILMAKPMSQVTVPATSVPNPFLDRFVTYFDTPLTQRGTLSVLDMRGVLLQQIQLVPGQDQAEVRLGQVPAGMYVLRFQSGDEQWTHLLRH
jgi:hypothetical protein